MLFAGTARWDVTVAAVAIVWGGYMLVELFAMKLCMLLLNGGNGAGQIPNRRQLLNGLSKL